MPRFVGRSTTVHSILFCAHPLCVNYVTNMLLLVSSTVWSKQLLCFVHGRGKKKRERERGKKNIQR